MLNRFVCSVLEEMRQCHKTGNYSHLLGLVEEAQTMFNRMEAKLYDQKDYERMLIRVKKLKKEIKKLEAKKRKHK